MDWIINNKAEPLKGKIKVPADKSISHRAAMFAAISEGNCKIKNFLFAEDCMRTVEALTKMGAEFKKEKNGFSVKGKGLNGLKLSESTIFLGNSGTSMRILPGIVSGQDVSVTFTGDESLMKRPMSRITDPLLKMGVSIEALGEGGTPPIRVKPVKRKLVPIDYNTPVASAQVKSCLLAASLYASGKTRLTEPYISRDHTERMLSYLGVGIERDRTTIEITPSPLKARDIDIPADLSSAAFFIAAASILPGSRIFIENVGINPTRAGFLTVLDRMGAKINFSNITEGMERTADLEVSFSELKAAKVKASEVPALIDEVPILAVVAAYAEGDTVIEGISELKVKESDRINSIVTNFQKLGLKACESNGKLVISGSRSNLPIEAEVRSFSDHRIAMAMAVCSLVSKKRILIKNVDCVKTSYPDFYDDMSSLRK